MNNKSEARECSPKFMKLDCFDMQKISKVWDLSSQIWDHPGHLCPKFYESVHYSISLYVLKHKSL